MTITQSALQSAPVATTPLDRILNASLLVAPLVYLAADSTYAARGWNDATAGVLHVVGAILYGLVILRVAAWLPARSKLAAAIVTTGIVGLAGNVAYGFDAIHTSYGDTKLVDRTGAATLIKPLGLFFPLSFALAAWAVARLGSRRAAVLIFVAMAVWPVAHIANLGAPAVAVNVVLVVAFGLLAWTRFPAGTLDRNDA